MAQDRKDTSTQKGKSGSTKPKAAATPKKKSAGTAPAPFARREPLFMRHGSALCLAAGLLLLFVSVVPGRSGWLWMHDVYRGVLGIGAYGLVLVFLAGAIVFSSEKGRAGAGSRVKYVGLMGTVLLSAWHLLCSEDFYLEASDLWTQITDAFAPESILRSGGAFGAAIGGVLSYMGKVPALLILGVLLLTLILFWTHNTVLSAAGNVSLWAKKILGKNATDEKEETVPDKKVRRKSAVKQDDNADEDDEDAPDEERDIPADVFHIVPDEAEVTAPKSRAKNATPAKKVFVTPDPAVEPGEYHFPPLSILKESVRDAGSALAQEQEQSTARTLVETLESFGVRATISDIARGPSVTRYELLPDAGVRINKITNLADDIALRLAAVGVRIEAPIPGKAAVGIEVPNRHKSAVGLREIIDSPIYKRVRSKLCVALGRDISGQVMCCDLAKMPHLLIAGTTGSGKSVCMNTMICSLLFNASPDEVRLLMIDPKQVEFSVYNGVPHLEIPVVSDPRKAAGALAWAVGEMEKRYKLLSEHGARDITSFNELAARTGDFDPLTRMVIFIDELADLMMIAPKDVEDSICRLAQKARAAGIHLVIATQRPSVDVITGLIKANIPSRIALSVSSQIDSRTILDIGGAEKLLGYGDMLYLPIDMQKPVRVQGCFISDAEVEQVVRFVSMQTDGEVNADVLGEIDRLAVELGTKKKPGGGDPMDFGNDDGERDENFEEAVRVVVEAEMASTTLLQRRLKLGYARASRVIDELEQAGIVGPFEGSKPRKVLISKSQYYERTALGASFVPAPDEPPPWEE
ncbi:MAG: DNA translocase FtsK [Oscillospiraceae bacterium]|nr:DNA translocase FtsK [Oscillospiraceae bacterium]